MIWFLQNHERYAETYWGKRNNQGRYSNDVKIPNLFLSDEEENKLYELMGDHLVYSVMSIEIKKFTEAHGDVWTAMWMGRMGGHFTLCGINKPGLGDTYKPCPEDEDDPDDIKNWPTYKLKERVQLVQDFDKLTDTCISIALAWEMPPVEEVSAEEDGLIPCPYCGKKFKPEIQ